ncbi:MAG TPA: hypothetical protein VJ813_08875 [Vicinamibacterales bacterium]|nr:hypothetical protein [Vicinamibacterales bacterium]
MNLRIATAAAVTLMVACTGTASAQQTTKRDHVVNELSGFNVVLVIGDTQRGRSSTENMPDGAARALKDMGEFLPYKSYRVLDAQWTSCCVPKPATTVSGRLQGVFEFVPDEKAGPVQAQSAFAFSITASTSMANIPVRFVLSADDPDSRRGSQSAEKVRQAERELQDFQAELESLTAQIQRMRSRVEVGTAPPDDLRPLQDRHALIQRRMAALKQDLESAPHGARPIIDSSFTMAAGETVVVGTSKLGGNQALIALVTAVRKGGRE